MKVENMTYNAKTAFTERREIIDKLNECINSINTYGPEKIADLESKNIQQDADINNLKNADTNNVKINKINEYAVGLTGNQENITGIKGFVETIRGRVTNVLYAEYSGILPAGKYKQFAKISAGNPDSMIVLDVMVSSNGANFGFGRIMIGNPTTVNWFCKWIYRKSNGWMDADSIQIAKDIATGDLMIFAKNPTVTGLAINLVYSKYGPDIQGTVRVEKVTNTTNYSLDGTDSGIGGIIAGSDMS